MLLNKLSTFPSWAELPISFRLLEEAAAAEQPQRPWLPSFDILEEEDRLVLQADLPGIDISKIDIRIENGTLTVKGRRDVAPKSEKSSYHRIERPYGQFARSFTLPNSIDPEKVAAEYNNGVLQINLAKKEVAKPRSIQVQLS
jgi:HSP20 family protein